MMEVAEWEREEEKVELMTSEKSKSEELMSLRLEDER